MHDQGPQSNSHQTFPSLLHNSSKPRRLKEISDLLWVNEGIRHFRYPVLLGNPHLKHGVFTRHGGESAPPFHSLNTSYSVGDLPEHVAGNLSRIKNILGAERLAFMNQSHGTEIAVLGEVCGEGPDSTPRADVIMTERPRIALLVKQADCQGVIIFDPGKRVLANVHCGWRGNVRNILGRVIARMGQEFGCKAEDLFAAIGPSLGPCCSEFVSYREIFPKSFEHFMVRENYIDLWAVSCWQLVEAGVRNKNIELAGICTRCRTDLFYSYRGEGKTGRFATAAMLV